MDERIDFGTLGLKIGDKLAFAHDKTSFIVGSGNGTPGNGGTLVAYEDTREVGLFSLRYMTRRLMGENFDEAEDIYSLWTHQGKTLRSIYQEMTDDTPNLIKTERKI